jgi:hypothetical protein
MALQYRKNSTLWWHSFARSPWQLCWSRYNNLSHFVKVHLIVYSNSPLNAILNVHTLTACLPNTRFNIILPCTLRFPKGVYFIIMVQKRISPGVPQLSPISLLPLFEHFNYIWPITAAALFKAWNVLYSSKTVRVIFEPHSGHGSISVTCCVVVWRLRPCKGPSLVDRFLQKVYKDPESRKTEALSSFHF